MNAPGPLLAIRADASHHGGTGHIMRTLAIAQTWLARGGRVRFLCAALPDALEQKLISSGADVVRIDPENDAFDTAAAVTDGGAVALLVDHYDLTDNWWCAANHAALENRRTERLHRADPSAGRLADFTTRGSAAGRSAFGSGVFIGPR